MTKLLHVTPVLGTKSQFSSRGRAPHGHSFALSAQKRAQWAAPSLGPSSRSLCQIARMSCGDKASKTSLLNWKFPLKKVSLAPRQRNKNANNELYATILPTSIFSRVHVWKYVLVPPLTKTPPMNSCKSMRRNSFSMQERSISFMYFKKILRVLFLK